MEIKCVIPIHCSGCGEILGVSWDKIPNEIKIKCLDCAEHSSDKLSNTKE